MRATSAGMAGIGLAISACGPVQAQTSPYRIGDKVELQANGDHWQSCVVIEPGSRESVMRMQCEPYDAPGYRRAGGIYAESFDSSGVRKVGATGPASTPAAPNAGGVANTPPPMANGAPAAGAAGAATGAGYRVGQPVEMEASKHWVPCVVSSIEPGGVLPLIRVDCPAYPELSRVAGTYIVDDVEAGLRPATGRIGPEAAPVPERPNQAAAGPAGSLPLGEYTCVGSGGRMMYGFKLTGPSTYTDLDGASPGTYAINGTNISFNGGYLDGVSGREIKGNGFRIAAQAECELWQ